MKIYRNSLKLDTKPNSVTDISEKKVVMNKQNK